MYDLTQLPESINKTRDYFTNDNFNTVNARRKPQR